MISTLAYRSQLQSEKTAGLSRFGSMRGRVLTGFGGDLAGYNTSLIQSRAAQEDQLMQKKYDRGEISYDELLSYLTKTTERSWLSKEEKDLLKSNIEDLKIKYEDEKVANEYNSGRMTAADVATYQRSKLAKMLPGTPVYENQLSEIAKWDKTDKTNKAKEYVAKEEARIAGIADQSNAYSEKANVYRQAANLFRQAGDTMTAYSYEEAANSADIAKQQYDVQVAEKSSEQGKSDLVDNINLAYNEYHDGRISGQEFLALLDEYERSAINNKYTDLLDDMNKLVDMVNEDKTKGRTSSAGGGTGDFYSGGISTKTISTGTQATTPEEQQTPEQQDQMFKDGFAQVNREILDGTISKQEYIQSVQDLVSARKTDLENRKAQLEQYGNAKVYYNGTKTSAKKLIAEIDDELNNNWGKLLGLTESEVGSAGINDMGTALQGDAANISQTIDLVVSQPTKLGGDYTATLTAQKPLSTGYVSDELGRMYKVQNQKKEDVLDFDTYASLVNSGQVKPEDYQSKSDGTYVKKGSVRWIDIPSAGGDTARYFLDENDNVTDFTPTIKDQTKYQQYLPEGQTITDYLKTQPKPTTIKPLQQVINEATTAAQLAKKQAEEATVSGQITTPGVQKIQDQTYKGPSYGETLKDNMLKVIAPIQKATQINVPAPATAGKDFADKFVSPLAPSKIQQPQKTVTPITSVAPASFVGPLKSNQVSMADPLKNIKATQAALSYTPPKTTTATQPKQNIIQKATSWVSNLFKKKQ